MPGFFETIGAKIMLGRPITEQDTAASRKVAVINQAFARRFFKDQNPVGQHFGPDKIADHVMAGDATHRPRVLARHHRRMGAVDEGRGGVAGGENTLRRLHPQETIGCDAAKPVMRARQRRRQRMRPHAGAPNDRRSVDRFAR